MNRRKQVLRFLVASTVFLTSAAFAQTGWDFAELDWDYGVPAGYASAMMISDASAAAIPGTEDIGVAYVVNWTDEGAPNADWLIQVRYAVWDADGGVSGGAWLDPVALPQPDSADMEFPCMPGTFEGQWGDVSLAYLSDGTPVIAYGVFVVFHSADEGDGAHRFGLYTKPSSTWVNHEDTRYTVDTSYEAPVTVAVAISDDGEGGETVHMAYGSSYNTVYAYAWPNIHKATVEYHEVAYNSLADWNTAVTLASQGPSLNRPWVYDVALQTYDEEPTVVFGLTNTSGNNYAVIKERSGATWGTTAYSSDPEEVALAINPDDGAKYVVWVPASGTYEDDILGVAKSAGQGWSPSAVLLVASVSQLGSMTINPLTGQPCLAAVEWLDDDNVGNQDNDGVRAVLYQRQPTTGNWRQLGTASEVTADEDWRYHPVFIEDGVPVHLVGFGEDASANDVPGIRKYAYKDDDFSDGGYDKLPEWFGDTGYWTVNVNNWLVNTEDSTYWTHLDTLLNHSDVEICFGCRLDDTNGQGQINFRENGSTRWGLQILDGQLILWEGAYGWSASYNNTFSYNPFKITCEGNNVKVEHWFYGWTTIFNVTGTAGINEGDRIRLWAKPDTVTYYDNFEITILD